MTNQELAQNNQQLHSKIQTLTIAMQQAEAENLELKERCTKLQVNLEDVHRELLTVKVLLYFPMRS